MQAVDDVPAGPAVVPRKGPQQTTEEHLIERIKLVIEGINARDTSRLDPELVSPNFVDTSERKNGTEKQSAQMAVRYMKQHVEAYPTYRVELLGVTTEIDEKKGTATVYAQISTHDAAEGVELESMSIAEFRRNKDNRWILTKHYGMRGVAPFPM